MKRIIFFGCAVLCQIALAGGSEVGSMQAAGEPARRPAQPQGYSIPATAICKDEAYVCMYKCSVKEGSVCTPTKGSDRNCPNRTVTNGHWITKKLVVLDFDNYHDMGCNVISPARSNVYCGDSKYGWGCWTGRLHVDNN